MSGRRVLITGAGGYLGTQLLSALQERGDATATRPIGFAHGAALQIGLSDQFAWRVRGATVGAPTGGFRVRSLEWSDLAVRHLLDRERVESVH